MASQAGSGNSGVSLGADKGNEQQGGLGADKREAHGDETRQLAAWPPRYLSNYEREMTGRITYRKVRTKGTRAEGTLPRYSDDLAALPIVLVRTSRKVVRQVTRAANP